MKLYTAMSRFGRPRSFMGKIMLVSFVGVHIPIFGAAVFAVLWSGGSLSEKIPMLLAMLVATLVGTALTMMAMGALMAPVRQASRALDAYLRHRTVPSLPTRFTDDAGMLMASVQESVTRLDSALTAARLGQETMHRETAGKFRVISGLSHDIRTPLNHILGFAELMRSDDIGPLGDDSYREFADTVGESGQDLLALLQNVLALSEAEAAVELKEEAVTLDLDAFARETLALEHLHAERRGVDIALGANSAGSADLPKQTLRQALSAMLQVGISQARPLDGVGVGDVAVSVIRDAEGHIVLTVRDHGRMLAEQDVPDNLVRGGLTGTLAEDEIRTPEGIHSNSPTALRLSLVQTLARAMGGNFSVHSFTEAGTEQRLILPADGASGAETLAA